VLRVGLRLGIWDVSADQERVVVAVLGLIERIRLAEPRLPAGMTFGKFDAQVLVESVVDSRVAAVLGREAKQGRVHSHPKVSLFLW